jgi:hypothetical protein
MVLSFTAYGFNIFNCVIFGLKDFSFFKRLMQKTYLFSLQIGMPQANALNSLGYTDTVLFLTIGKPDIYKPKSLGKSATVFYPCYQ